jgi:hypothetical protein
MVDLPHRRGDAEVAVRAGAASMTADRVMKRILATNLARLADGVRRMPHAAALDASRQVPPGRQ